MKTETKSTHTPGKWYVEKPYSDKGVYVTTDYNSAMIAAFCFNDGEPFDNAEANARLIAAAPEMLEALKNLVERGLIKDTDGDHYDEVVEAIAKAEGE